MIMEARGVCPVCAGRANRQCPASKGLICSACCGEGRGSRIECPAECAHYPFGTKNYDLWLQVDGGWTRKTLEYALTHCDQDELKALAEKMAPSLDDELLQTEMGYTYAVHYLLDGRKDGNGKTLADRWEEQKWKGLNNDERVMMRHRRHSTAALLEIQRKRDDHSCECLDILDPGRGVFLLFDRMIAARATRFTRFVTWITHYPHFVRPVGVGTEVPEQAWDPFLKEVRRRARNWGRASEDSIRRHIVENFRDVCQLPGDIMEEVREQMFQSLDVHHCQAFYRIRGRREEVLRILKEKPDFELNEDPANGEDPEGTIRYVWLRRGEAKTFEKLMPSLFRLDDGDARGTGILGNFRLRPDSVVVEAFSRKRFDFAKKLAKDYFGDLLEFENETDENLAEQAVRKGADTADDPGGTKPFEKANAIPKEVEQEIMQRYFEQFYRKLMDEKVPALKNMTPREAARSPEMKPELVEWVKVHLRSMDRMGRNKGIRLDVDWFARDLGLGDLL